MLLTLETANSNGAISLTDLTAAETQTFLLRSGQQAAADLPVLIKQHVDLSAVTAIAVCQGPGSFTGIRVGLSLAKGLAYARNLPTYPVNSLQALANFHKLETVTMPAVGGGFFQQHFALHKKDCYRPTSEIEHIEFADHALEVPDITMVTATALKLVQQHSIPAPLMPFYIKPCYAKAKRLA